MNKKLPFGDAFVRYACIGCILVLQVSCASGGKLLSGRRSTSDEFQKKLVEEEVINGNALALFYGPHSFMWSFIKQGGHGSPDPGNSAPRDTERIPGENTTRAN